MLYSLNILRRHYEAEKSQGILMKLWWNNWNWSFWWKLKIDNCDENQKLIILMKIKIDCWCWYQRQKHFIITSEGQQSVPQPVDCNGATPVLQTCECLLQQTCQPQKQWILVPCKSNNISSVCWKISEIFTF